MIFATVVFCLPTEMPPTPDNMNYASIAFGATCAASTATFFFPRYGAYKWFKGPAHTVDDDSAHVEAGMSPAGKDIV